MVAEDYSEQRRYTEEHEWLEVDGDTATLGVTFYAQQELGDVVFVELPEKGAVFEAGQEIGTIESVKAAAELFTPVAGEVLETNGLVSDSPELVNEDPHGQGWLVKLKLSDPSGADKLMTAEQYKKLIEGQS